MGSPALWFQWDSISGRHQEDTQVQKPSEDCYLLTQLPPQILSVRQSSYIALDPGTFHSPTPSILGVEMTPDVANFVLVSLNPTILLFFFSCSAVSDSS